LEFISNIKDLESHYGAVGKATNAKVADGLTPNYRKWIKASSFCALATVGPDGADCSPRGDAGEVAFEPGPHTLAIPDRRGNNRIDSLRNIVADGRVALMFMVAGSNSVVRVNGQAKVTVDPDLIARIAKDGHLPRSVIVVAIEQVYFQCALALMRSNLWGDGPDISDLPTPGDMLSEMTKGQEGGASYDQAWPERAQKSLW